MTLLLFSSPTFSQSDRIVAQASLAEKIYLQVDADVYTTDQNIWFKALVLESSSHQPSNLSGVLYVDLIAPDEQIIVQKRIKLNYGVGEGSIALSEKMIQGKYLLRAYTTWNKNFDRDFIFQKYISLFSTSENLKSNPNSKTVAPPQAPIDLQFFPEGGEWLIDMQSWTGNSHFRKNR